MENSSQTNTNCKNQSPASSFIFQNTEEYDLINIRNHYPLLWILSIQIIAYLFCGSNIGSTKDLTFSGYIVGSIFFFLSGITAYFKIKKNSPIAKKLWNVFFPTCLFFFFCSWWNICAPQKINWENQPDSELELTLNIERTFSSQGEKWNGIARIENAPYLNPELIDKRIYYSFDKKESDKNIIPIEGQRIECFGVVSALKEEDIRNNHFYEFLNNSRISTLYERGKINNVLIDDTNGFLKRTFYDILKSITNKICEQKTFESGSHLLGAILLGEKNLLTDNQKNNLALTGTMHLIAVSGLHIAIIALGIIFFFKTIRIPNKINFIASTIIILAYVLVIGAPPSAIRAWLMITFLFIAKLLSRQKSGLAGLIASAVFALFINPEDLFDLGFQLSYSVVIMLILYASPLIKIIKDAWLPYRLIPPNSQTFIQKFNAWAYNLIIDTGIISFSAFFITSFFIVAYFNIFAPASILFNIIIVPIIMPIIYIGVVGLILLHIPFLEIISNLLWNTATALIEGIDFLIGKCAGLNLDIQLSITEREIGSLGGLALIIFVFYAENCMTKKSQLPLKFGIPPLFTLLFFILIAH